MWDGFLCWDETPAGTSVTQNCPDHPDPDPTGEKDLLAPIHNDKLPELFYSSSAGNTENDPIFCVQLGSKVMGLTVRKKGPLASIWLQEAWRVFILYFICDSQGKVG